MKAILRALFFPVQVVSRRWRGSWKTQAAAVAGAVLLAAALVFGGRYLIKKVWPPKARELSTVAVVQAVDDPNFHQTLLHYHTGKSLSYDDVEGFIRSN